MREYLARNLKADVNILVLSIIILVSLRKLAPSRNVVSTRTSSIRMAWTFIFCKTPVVDEKFLILAIDRG